MGIRRDRLPVVVVGALGFVAWAVPGLASQNWDLAWKLPLMVCALGSLIYTGQKVLSYVMGTDEEEAKN